MQSGLGSGIRAQSHYAPHVFLSNALLRRLNHPVKEPASPFVAESQSSSRSYVRRRTVTTRSVTPGFIFVDVS